MRDELKIFVSDENALSTSMSTASQQTIFDAVTSSTDSCTLSVKSSSDRNELLDWAAEQLRIDQVVRDAADWKDAATFFPKRDQSLREALQLAYPVFVLLTFRRDVAEAELEIHRVAQGLSKNLVRGKPALAALKLVTKPQNKEEEKRCSEWSNKLKWAYNNSILPSKFFKVVNTVTLAHAKAEVRKQRRSDEDVSGKPARVKKTLIKVTVSGDKGKKTFDFELSQTEYDSLMSVEKHHSWKNARHMLGYLKNIQKLVKQSNSK